jgi:lysyl-tRNA synthetase class 1
MLNEEKDWISTLVKNLQENDFTVEEMQALLYEIPKLNGEQNKVRQKRFFEIVYNLLLGKDKGPRLYL